MLRALKISARSFSIQRSVLPTKAPSADGKKPPTVEEFNYLDPKGWQIGVGLKSIFVFLVIHILLKTDFTLLIQNFFVFGFF